MWVAGQGLCGWLKTYVSFIICFMNVLTYFVCLVVINPCVLSAKRVDFGLFLFHKFTKFTFPLPAGLMINTGLCAHYCNNTLGSYECICRDGYYVNAQACSMMDIVILYFLSSSLVFFFSLSLLHVFSQI